MTDWDEQFTPENVDEQIGQLLRISPPQDGSSAPELRLIHDLHYSYDEYTHMRDRVWERLIDHIAEVPTEPHLRAMTTRQRQQQSSMQPMQLYPIQPRQGARAIFVLMTSITIGILLVGSLAIFLHNFLPTLSSGTMTAAMASRSKSALATLSPKPVTNCAVGDAGWYALCLQHQVQSLYLSKTIADKTFVLQTAYADGNRVVITDVLQDVRGNMLKIPSMPTALTNITLKTRQGVELSSTGINGWYDEKITQSGEILSFDASSIPATTSKLDLQLRVELLHYQITSDNGNGHTSSIAITDGLALFDFSVPWHPARIVEPNQTVSAGGILITLKRVSVSPSETVVILSSPQVRIGNETQADPSPYILSVDGWSSKGQSMSAQIVNANGKGSAITGAKLAFVAPLYDRQGEWTLFISPTTVVGATAAWQFKFTVPEATTPAV